MGGLSSREIDHGLQQLFIIKGRAPSACKLTGPKPPLRPGHVWLIRAKLQLERRTRDLALFNLAIDSKLRGCDLVALNVDDVAPNGYAVDRATVRQRFVRARQQDRPPRPLRVEGGDPSGSGRLSAAERPEGRAMLVPRPPRS